MYSYKNNTLIDYVEFQEICSFIDLRCGMVEPGVQRLKSALR